MNKDLIKYFLLISTYTLSTLSILIAAVIMFNERPSTTKDLTVLLGIQCLIIVGLVNAGIYYGKKIGEENGLIACANAFDKLNKPAYTTKEETELKWKR